MPNWDKIAKHPATVIILGDVNEGKTSIQASLQQHYHKQKLVNYMIDKPEKYPKWVKPLKLSSKIPSNAVISYDDAHEYFYSREWQKGAAKEVELAGRRRRHEERRNTIILTTQQGSALDKNLFGITSCLIFRRPSKLQLQFERREIRDMCLKADEALREKDYSLDWAYVISGKVEGLFEVGKPPKWFTPSVSRSSRKIDKEEPNILMSIYKGIGKIGAMF